MSVTEDLKRHAEQYAARGVAQGRRLMRVDVHQHLWSEGLYASLARRDTPPRMRRRYGGWSLELAGEAPFTLAPEADTADARVADLGACGIDIGIVALSTALGVETLPGDEARDVLAAFDADADAFPSRLRAWGSVALDELDPDDVDRAVERGRIGITLPATAVCTPAGLDRVGPLLERLAERDAALFVHPGPAQPGAWSPCLTSYVTSLSDAWLAWVLHGRDQHPRVRIVFAALAGLGPLHAERVGARVSMTAARSAVDDEHTFFDTSTYGPVAVEAMLRAVGSRALVNGSDRPYAESIAPMASVRRAVVEENPAALLGVYSGVTS